jgi:sialic acid synthase SpsE/sugar phosphate isomerase/epimerase
MKIVIKRNIEDFCVNSEDSIIDALNKIEKNKNGVIFVVDEGGFFIGVLTDGDVRRALIEKNVVNLESKISSLANKKCVISLDSESSSEMAEKLASHITHIPILDSNQRVVGLLRRRTDREFFEISNRVIGEDSRVFVIAEIGLNHNGSYDLAKRLVDYSADAGVDAVKFQMRSLKNLYRGGKEIGSDEDLSVQYTLGLLKKFELSEPQMFELFDYARFKSLVPMCTPWDQESVNSLKKYGIPAYKIASADLTNHPLLTAVASAGMPMILSTGMATEGEIKQTVHLLNKQGASFALLHCNSTYPAPFKDINLSYMPRLSDIGGCQVGYSGHERGINIAIAAVGMGAKIIEKHITVDRNMEGSDHQASLLPDEFRLMVQGIRQVEDALGVDAERGLSQGEVMNRSNLAKSIIAARDINIGEEILSGMVEVKSPGRGLQPNKISELLFTKAKRNVKKGDFFYQSDLDKNSCEARKYHFPRPWGLTVRWHDMWRIMEKSNPDFLEFHLSYRDMDENYLANFTTPLDLDLKVHSPDTFSGDHLLDLSSLDSKHRKRSILELQRVIDLTREIKPFFKRAARPMIIASLGGVSKDNFIDTHQREQRYNLMSDSLSQLDTEGVEIIGQTLPPFPWYFGGQMHLNLFVHAEDTINFCKQNKMRLCFDTSHSKLACNFYKESFGDFVKKVAPFIAHIHFGDAKGIDGEGLQIGDGEIDFEHLINQLTILSPTSSFIPEIWQGHNNDGEGFWKALERLEGYFEK